MVRAFRTNGEQVVQKNVGINFTDEKGKVDQKEDGWMDCVMKIRRWKAKAWREEKKKKHI